VGDKGDFVLHFVDHFIPSASSVYSAGRLQRPKRLASSRRCASNMPDGHDTNSQSAPHGAITTFETLMKIRRGRQSGSLDNTVSVDSKYGQVLRSRPRRTRRDTEARQRARDACSYYARLWRTLTDKQQAGWTALGRSTPCRDSEETGACLHGCQALIKLNCALAAVGLPRLLDAPKRAKFGPTPVQRLRITNHQGQFKLELELDRKPRTHIVVLGSRPCSAGISVRNTFSTLGLLPAPKRGWNDITELYVRKFGVPRVGTRVFIRTRQLINGWEDAFKDIHARLPSA
jgi:hypothetical protein